VAENPIQRWTRQREVILEELRKLRSHPTAAGLYEVVRRRLPKVSLATVYRNLERLSELGYVRKLDLGGSETRFDGDLTRHDHVRCVRCGRMDDLRGPPLELGHGGQDDWGGYEIVDYRLEFLGVCPGCRPREGTVPREGSRG
jgi:Fur family ferric uptake transcriptional regulator